MTAHYLDDFAVGQTFNTGRVRVDKEQIVAFASQFDPQPFHLDEEAARASPFQGLAASGWHTAALTMRMLADGGAPIAGGTIGVGGEIAWPGPVRPEDTLMAESEVLTITPSRSKPNQAIVTMRTTTRNQTGAPVLVLTAKLIVFARP